MLEIQKISTSKWWCDDIFTKIFRKFGNHPQIFKSRGS